MGKIIALEELTDLRENTYDLQKHTIANIILIFREGSKIEKNIRSY